MGVCDVLEPKTSYRDLSWARRLCGQGASLRGLFAELYGKATGVAHGKGGSMHLIDMPHGVFGTSAMVGTTIPLAVGFALASGARRVTAWSLRFSAIARPKSVFHQEPELRRFA